MTDKKLHQMFTQIGQIEACRVMKDVKVSLSNFVVLWRLSVILAFVRLQSRVTSVGVDVGDGDIREKLKWNAAIVIPPHFFQGHSE